MGARFVRAAFAGLLLSASSAAMAADALKFGAPPAWVLPAKLPPSTGPASEAPIAMLLNDQQIHFASGQQTTFTEVAIKIQTAQGLSAGNVSIPWDPATDTVTVNKLHILRGGQVIDVLANQKFTTIRREANLEVATLDGRLTATIQPEGLQEGDIINFAVTQEHVDPVMKGHVESVFGMWNGIPTGLGRTRLIWPTGMKLKMRQSAELPKTKTVVRDGMNIAELSAENIQPLIAPASAPPRFQLGRIAEASSFESWSDIADLMMPLYQSAAAVPPSGPLRDEVERIRNGSADAKSRTEKALALVQDRVRYVALLMGDGGYVPATAEITWSRRFGDCKGKTALLLAILHELDIEAEAVAVHSLLGDAVPERLPMLGQLNHVLVRARIGGKSYWLDGTRTGDTGLERLQVPNFRWGLPLVAKAELVPMTPAPLVTPISEHLIEIDASGGVYAPAAVSIEQVFRGDGAVTLNLLYAQATGAQRDQALRETAKKQFDTIAVTSSALQFDKGKGELRLIVKGEAKLEWDDGWFFVPSSSVGYNPDFDRAAGPLHDVPFAIAHPDYGKRRVTIQLPPGFAAAQNRIPAAVKETLAGVEYDRSVEVKGDTITVEVSERSIAAEVPYKDALAAAGRLKTISNDDFHLGIPNTYRPSDKDVAALQQQTPRSAIEYFLRAGAHLANNEKDKALTDLDAGLALDPKNVWALNVRADALIDKQRLSEAEKDLTAGLAVDPQNAELLATRGVLAERQRDVAGAAQYYGKALQSDPKNFKARFGRAWLLNNKGDRDGAIADLTILIDHNPKNAFALAARAVIFANKQDYASAKKDIAAAQEIDAKNPLVAIAQQQIARSNHDLTKVIDIQTQLIGDNPKDGSRYPARAQAYYEAGKHDLAIKDTDQAIALGYKTPDIRLLRANLFRRQGNRDAAIKEAQLLVAENPKSDFALVAAARIFEALGKRAEAMAAFDAAIAVKPAAYVYLNRAQSRQRFDVAGRLADLDAALKLEPDNVDVLAMKAGMLSRDGKHEEAIQLYDRALAKAPAPVLYIVADRAVALSRAGRMAEAEKAYAEIRSMAKTALELNNLCWTKGTAGILLQSALDDCREALKLQPDSGAYLDSLGMVLLRLGKLDEALAAYDKAIAKSTGPSSLMGRAMVHMRKGDKARAEADRVEALKLDPDAETRFAEYGLKLQETGATPE